MEKPFSCRIRSAIWSKDSVFTYSSNVSCGSRSIRRSVPETISRLIDFTLVLSAMENQATVAAVTATSARRTSNTDVYRRLLAEIRVLLFFILPPPAVRLHKRQDADPRCQSSDRLSSPDHSPPDKNICPPDKSGLSPSSIMAVWGG